MINPWFTLGVQAARLTWEAQLVIGLRLMRLAAGGPPSESEARRLVPEKMGTLAEAGAAAASVAARGGKSHKVAESVLKVYKKRVGRNRRRLSKYLSIVDLGARANYGSQDDPQLPFARWPFLAAGCVSRRDHSADH
jgi:hypothetical protein